MKCDNCNRTYKKLYGVETHGCFCSKECYIEFRLKKLEEKEINTVSDVIRNKDNKILKFINERPMKH